MAVRDQHEIVAEDVDEKRGEEEEDRDPEAPMGVDMAPEGFGWVEVLFVGWMSWVLLFVFGFHPGSVREAEEGGMVKRALPGRVGGGLALFGYTLRSRRL